MTNKKRRPPTRPWGVLAIQLAKLSDEEILGALVESSPVKTAVVRRTLAGLVRFLQEVAKPDSLTPGIGPEEQHQAKETLNLIVKIYREVGELGRRG